MRPKYDVIVVGAGAAGLMCAITAAQRGRRVGVIDHAKKIGTKNQNFWRGVACNFTNLYADASHYLSQNPHFCKSALKQYSQFDFIDWVEETGIPYHEKSSGSSSAIEAPKTSWTCSSIEAVKRALTYYFR